MSCPKCGAETAQGQNYCGGCGARLQNACPGCDTINPTLFQYCGQCGRNLVDVGSMLLDRAGLIRAADATALQVIGQKTGRIKGKPFALFVKIDDLVIFYSHWNELIRSGKPQSVEIELVPSPGCTIHAQVEMRQLKGKTDQPMRVHMAISDVTDFRLAMQDAQVVQDLINLIFSWVDDFHPAQENERAVTISGVLEKLGLFSAAQYGFICRIDVKEKSLVTDFQWRMSSETPAPSTPPPMPIALMTRIFDKLIAAHQLIVNDLQTLPRLERQIFREWHRIEMGAIMCHMVYRRKTPVGIIGVAAARPTRWSDHAVSLVKLAGRLMAEALMRSRPGLAVIQASQTSEIPVETIDISDIEIIEEPPLKKSSAPAKPSRKASRSRGKTRPRMKFGIDKQTSDQGRNPVFAGEDGKYTMTCPQCGFQDTASGRLFDMMGAAVRVQCHCGHCFRIVRELRSGYRKKVRLEGYFAQELQQGNKLASGNAWGPMLVQNLSRAGLKFTCSNARMLRTGDRLKVRFNLDNANQILIKKTVVVKSVHGDMVGCQFHGADPYDAALGFYFL